MVDSKLFRHQTVLLNELVDVLNLKPGDLAVDCTAGGGGHTALLLEKVGVNGKVVAFDRDPIAIQFLKGRFADEISSGRLVLVNKAFSSISSYEFVHPVSGICADIGVSSPQLDIAERGFSFAKDGPLDMRMDPTRGESAADILNTYAEKELADLIYKYGEEPKSRVIARLIIQAREKAPFASTLQLAQLIDKQIHYSGKSRTHKATRTFQALRIAVNSELSELESVIADGFKLLAPKGRFAIITFHSLEDRIVKHQFRDFCGKSSKPNYELRHLPIQPPPPQAEIIKPFPTLPSDKEQEENPRSRSAKLRCIQKSESVVE